MFDVSYAAAWELGRGLTLQNQAAALAVYQWNRAEGLVQKQQAQALRSLRSSRMPFWGLRKPRKDRHRARAFCCAPRPSLAGPSCSWMAMTSSSKTIPSILPRNGWRREDGGPAPAAGGDALRRGWTPRTRGWGYSKTPRNRHTDEELQNERFLVPWKDEPRGVLDIQGLAWHLHTLPSRTATTTSAAFAPQMIEGVQKVRLSQQA
jgi:hypothetical protein